MISGSSTQFQKLDFRRPPKRVVSLVPSLTESMFDLGFGETLVGITDYCVHPADALSGIPRIGGTKNPHIDDLIDLAPDLVLANQEENSRLVIESLQTQGIPVWVTFPKTVRAALDVLWVLVGIFREQQAAARLQTLEIAFEWALNSASSMKPVRYFCPIWYEQIKTGRSLWMSFNRDTYPHDLLSIIGGKNVFADRFRRYPLLAEFNQADQQDPGERDTRYPRLVAAEIRDSNPDLIILPSEPFLFTEDHLDIISGELASVTAVNNANIRFVDGSLITWHGTRLGRALQELPHLIRG